MPITFRGRIPWDRTPLGLDNQYYGEMLSGDWVPKPMSNEIVKYVKSCVNAHKCITLHLHCEFSYQILNLFKLSLETTERFTFSDLAKNSRFSVACLLPMKA